MKGFIAKRKYDLEREHKLLDQNLIYFDAIKTKLYTDIQILVAFVWRKHRKRKRE